MSDVTPADVTLGEVYRSTLRIETSMTALAQELKDNQRLVMDKLEERASVLELDRVSEKVDAVDDRLTEIETWKVDVGKSIIRGRLTGMQRWVVVSGALGVAASLTLAALGVAGVH